MPKQTILPGSFCGTISWTCPVTNVEMSLYGNKSINDIRIYIEQAPYNPIYPNYIVKEREVHCSCGETHLLKF